MNDENPVDSVDAVLVPGEVLKMLLEYLEERPLREVSGLYNQLLSCKVVTVETRLKDKKPDDESGEADKA